MAEGDWEGLEGDMRRFEGKPGTEKKSRSKLLYLVPLIAVAIAVSVYFVFYVYDGPAENLISVQEAPLEVIVEEEVAGGAQAAEGQQEPVVEEPEIIDCTKAGLEVVDVVYAPSGNQMAFTVENTGGADFAGLLAEVFFPDGTAHSSSYVQDLRSGETDTYVLGGVLEDYESVAVTSIECLDVSDTVSRAGVEVQEDS